MEGIQWNRPRPCYANTREVRSGDAVKGDKGQIPVVFTLNKIIQSQFKPQKVFFQQNTHSRYRNI
jgi:hypothetical protein